MREANPRREEAPTTPITHNDDTCRKIGVSGNGRPAVAAEQPDSGEEARGACENGFSIYELSNIMGISRSALRHYASLGIVTPAYVDDERNFRYYDHEQVDEIRLAKAVFDSGRRGADMVPFFGEDDTDLEGLLALAGDGAAEIMRNTRRLMQDIAYCQRAMRRMDAVGRRDGFYLRYVPMRVVAVMPAGSAESSLGDKLRLTEYLRRASRACGWPNTLREGTLHVRRLTGGHAEADDTRACLFLELSSPPTPRLTHSIEGGCYRMASGFSDCNQANSPACTSCARAGDDWPKPLPSPAVGNGPTSRITLLASELGEPYASGPWARFTQEHLQSRRPGKSDTPPRATKDDVPAYRPMRMPSIYRLPSEVTAAALPEGLYLCRQHDGSPENRSACEKALLEAASAIGSRTLGADEEAALAEAFLAKRAERVKEHKRSDVRHVAEPFFRSNCRVDADPTFGLRTFKEGEAVSGVRLAEGTIFGSDGFHVVDHRMMFSQQPKRPTYEMQIAVLEA